LDLRVARDQMNTIAATNVNAAQIMKTLKEFVSPMLTSSL